MDPPGGVTHDRTADLVNVLDLEPLDDGRFRAQNFTAGLGGVVFGGQLLAQSIVAASTVDPSKEVKSIHTVFSRAGALDQPLDIEVDPMHVGRALASATVTVRQGERLCTRSLVPAERGRAGPHPPRHRGPRRRFAR